MSKEIYTVNQVRAEQILKTYGTTTDIKDAVTFGVGLSERIQDGHIEIVAGRLVEGSLADEQQMLLQYGFEDKQNSVVYNLSRQEDIDGLNRLIKEAEKTEFFKRARGQK